MIDVVVPVLGRPQNAQPLVESIRASTTVPYTITFVCSPHDLAEQNACAETALSGDDDIEVIIAQWESGPGDFAKKTNYGFALTHGEWVMLGADDLTFTDGWDKAALAVGEKGFGVVGTNDCRNPLVIRGRHATHSLVSRRYISEVGGTFSDGAGVVYSEAYSHQAVDNELVAAARGRNEWAFAHDSVVIHNHPIYDKTVAMDDTYRRALADGGADKRLYVQRLKEWSKR